MSPTRFSSTSTSTQSLSYNELVISLHQLVFAISIFTLRTFLHPSGVTSPMAMARAASLPAFIHTPAISASVFFGADNLRW
ncbi:hypothetical protein B0H16DRAFT_628164 [Mycena metata]|uniref:Uncharacterized protein n=1 Tax=Mycena metata TaxID=1033252 RepID=A0AAD7KAK3_9AGAR|nr:hypothetical protein B0H16DRAFT_628164 [Mycena metata]